MIKIGPVFDNIQFLSSNEIVLFDVLQVLVPPVSQVNLLCWLSELLGAWVAPGPPTLGRSRGVVLESSSNWWHVFLAHDGGSSACT